MDHSLLASVGHVGLAAARRDAAAIQVGTQAAPSPFERPALGTPQVPASGAAMGATARCGAGGCGAAAGAAAEPPGARRWPVEHPGIAANESMLDCVRCHATKDRHQGLLGGNCVQCHATSQWTIAEFAHPSARSTECAQCHQPPPSHNMMHFSMMSAPLAKQPDAKVNQCFMCHQTTVWNDIKGLGWKKVH